MRYYRVTLVTSCGCRKDIPGLFKKAPEEILMPLGVFEVKDHIFQYVKAITDRPTYRKFIPFSFMRESTFDLEDTHWWEYHEDNRRTE